MRAAGRAVAADPGVGRGGPGAGPARRHPRFRAELPRPGRAGRRSRCADQRDPACDRTQCSLRSVAAERAGRRDGVVAAAGNAEYSYLWDYLTYHLKAAGLSAELDGVCCDLRFLAVRLRRSGPAAVEADLARSGSPTAARLRRTVAQNVHLLGPIEPAGSPDHRADQPSWRQPRACRPAARGPVRPAGLDSLAVLAAAGPAPRCADPGPHRPRRRGVAVAIAPGRHLAGHRRRRRDGAAVGRRRRPPRHPHRPHRRG